VARDAVGLHIGLAARVERALLGLGQPVGVEREVAPIGRERVRRQTVLDPQRIDETVDRLLARVARAVVQTLTPA
jgi:hypothetical protein